MGTFKEVPAGHKLMEIGGYIKGMPMRGCALACAHMLSYTCAEHADATPAPRHPSMAQLLRIHGAPVGPRHLRDCMVLYDPLPLPLYVCPLEVSLFSVARGSPNP